MCQAAKQTFISDIAVDVAPEGYGTYYNGLFDATLPAGMKARIRLVRSSAFRSLIRRQE